MTKTTDIVVSEVHISLIKPQGGLIALAKVVLNHAIALDSIGVHCKLSGGYRLTYPTKSGRYLFHPVSKAVGETIEQSIYDEVSKMLKAVNHDRYCGPYPTA